MSFDPRPYINDVYQPLIFDKSRFLLLVGGAGSGKSHFACQKILSRIVWAMQKGLRHKFLVLRKTQPDARRSVFALFNYYISKFGLTDLFHRNRTEMTYTLKEKPYSEIMFTGIDDPEKIKSIEGITGIWVEEATEINENDFNQLNLRLRGKVKTYFQLLLAFNPISKNNWIYKKFFENNEQDAKILKTNYKNNRFLDEEYVKQLENLKETNKELWNIYGKGEFTDLPDVIYNNYVVDSLGSQKVDNSYYGLDFGFNNPTALIEVNESDRRYFAREVLYKTKITNNDLIDFLKTIPKKDIYADSAEPNRIEEIKRAGFNIYPSNKDIKAGIDFCKSRQLKIDKNSVNLIKEIQGYCYKKNKDGELIDEPVKYADHLMDAMRYAIYTRFKAKREPGRFDNADFFA